MPEDPRGPIQRMLERYAEENALRFHMPGHKGLARLPYAHLDVTEVPGTDMLFHPSEGIFEAEAEAARCWRAARSFLLVNGSTAGVQAMLLWAKARGRVVLLPRDCHVSAIYACAAAGLQPLWLEPGWDAGEQLIRFSFDPALPEGPFALFLTYPDYYGRCFSFDTVLSKIGHKDCALLVDSAHGAHFTFSDRLPPDAGQIAVLWVSGAHKTLPAPTQTAFLHVKCGEDEGETARLLRGVTTTSPSYLLMAGLDNSRVFMQSNKGKLEALIDGCLELAERLNRVDGLRCWRVADARAMGYGALDPTRLVVDVRGLGLTGWEAGARLRELGVQAEMCDACRVVFIATVMDDAPRLRTLEAALVKLASVRRTSVAAPVLVALPGRGEIAMTLRQAWLSETEEIKLRQAVGCIAAEPFGAYPPGIPLCMPGEVITPEIVDAALEIKGEGGSFFGVRDGRVAVVKG